MEGVAKISYQPKFSSIVLVVCQNQRMLELCICFDVILNYVCKLFQAKEKNYNEMIEMLIYLTLIHTVQQFQ